MVPGLILVHRNALTHVSACNESCMHQRFKRHFTLRSMTPSEHTDELRCCDARSEIRVQGRRVIHCRDIDCSVCMGTGTCLVVRGDK